MFRLSCMPLCWGQFYLRSYLTTVPLYEFKILQNGWFWRFTKLNPYENLWICSTCVIITFERGKHCIGIKRGGNWNEFEFWFLGLSIMWSLTYWDPLAYLLLYIVIQFYNVDMLVPILEQRIVNLLSVFWNIFRINIPASFQRNAISHHTLSKRQVKNNQFWLCRAQRRN